MADSADDFQKQHTVVIPEDTDEGDTDDSDVDLDNAIDEGQYSISGSEAAPESDDNVATAAQAVGLYQKDDGENPQELDLASEIEKAEKGIQDSPPPGSSVVTDDDLPEEDEG